MEPFVTVEARVLGARHPLLGNWRVAIAPGEQAAETIPLRAFITRVVHQEVAAFTARQEERRFDRIFGPGEIAVAARVGKVDPAGRDAGPAVDPEAATTTALQAFEDGLYLVLVDGRQQTELDAEITLHPESRVTFVRLVALAGG